MNVLRRLGNVLSRTEEQIPENRSGNRLSEILTIPVSAEGACRLRASGRAAAGGAAASGGRALEYFRVITALPPTISRTSFLPGSDAGDTVGSWPVGSAAAGESPPPLTLGRGWCGTG
jgi:hypothetical protein